jgi:hypothetical protein
MDRERVSRRLHILSNSGVTVNNTTGIDPNPVAGGQAHFHSVKLGELWLRGRQQHGRLLLSPLSGYRFGNNDVQP